MPDPILTASGITVQFPGSTQTAVADADLVVEEGAAIGLVGESGSGKTTLGRVLVGALEPHGRQRSRSPAARGARSSATTRCEAPPR